MRVSPTVMNWPIFSSRSISAFLIIIASIFFPKCSAPANQGAIVYKNNCAGCHGAELQGSVSPSLTGTLKHGDVRESILQTIRNGIPGTQMIKWSGALSDSDINAVADFILEVRKSPNSIKSQEQPLQVQTKLYNLNIEKLITHGLEGPWGIEFIDSNHAYITGKNGDLYPIIKGKLDSQKIKGLPKTYATDLVGGMMDLALDPDYKNNGWIYLAFSHNSKNSSDKDTPGMTMIVRGKVNEHQWTNQQTLFQVPDSLEVYHGTRWGCRFFFDKQRYLYFTIGDMQEAKQSGVDPQLPSKPQGKIYRINSDGSIPKDNPLYGKKGVLQAIFCWGVRNVQGLAQHPVTGKIYFTDHGPRGGDELNILKNGGNYGWPLATYGINYDSTIISKDTAKPGTEQPITYWTPSIAVCAAEFVQHSLFPKWENNLLVTALKYEELRRLVVEDDKVLEQEILLKGYGRVRDVKVGPDGALYVLTNAPDALLRITPL